jgi:hypothetical protein
VFFLAKYNLEPNTFNSSFYYVLNFDKFPRVFTRTNGYSSQIHTAAEYYLRSIFEKLDKDDLNFVPLLRVFYSGRNLIISTQWFDIINMLDSFIFPL